MTRGHPRRSAAPARIDRHGAMPARSELMTARERRLALIARPQGPPASRFLAQAHALLTRSWATASWRARVDILRAVDWLLTAERERRMSLGDRAGRTVDSVGHVRDAAPPSSGRRHLAG